jgi:succinate-acetate transporter protein
MTETTAIALKDTSANPAPLGLFAFGMTTILLNLHNAGFFEINSMILAMGIFYGGLAQIVAGIMESKKNNTFGFTAFISYGFFWITLVALIVMPKLGWMAAPSTGAMIAFLIVWGIFTALLFIGTLKISKALQFVFASLALLFFLLALGDATDNSAIKSFTGYEGII